MVIEMGDGRWAIGDWRWAMGDGTVGINVITKPKPKPKHNDADASRTKRTKRTKVWLGGAAAQPPNNFARRFKF